MRFLKLFGLLLMLAVLAFIGFFIWGSSGTLGEEALAMVSTYDVPAAPPSDTLTVVTYNIGYLSGMTNNQPIAREEAFFSENLDAAARLLDGAQPDLVAFQEIDFGAHRSFDVDQLDALAERGRYRAAAAAVNWDERYVPFPSMFSPEMHFKDVVSGQGLLSRYPILHHERIVLERPETVAGYPPIVDRLALAVYIDRLAEVAIVDVGRPMVVINVHLEAWDTAIRERQAEQVMDLYRRYRDDYPVLLVGDFNSLLPADPVLGKISPEERAYYATDQTIDIILRDGTLREAFPDAALDTPTAPYTYPADAPSQKIDHLFYETADFEALDAFVLGGPDQPSDHRAVAARFVLK